MFGFILLIILCVILWPLIRLILAVTIVSHKARKMRNEFFGNGGERYRQPQPEPTVHKKKIPDDVGEYVRFEEINVTSTRQTDSADNTTKTYVREEQVVDVEWTDIADSGKEAV